MDNKIEDIKKNFMAGFHYARTANSDYSDEECFKNYLKCAYKVQAKEADPEICEQCANIGDDDRCKIGKDCYNNFISSIKEIKCSNSGCDWRDHRNEVCIHRDGKCLNHNRKE